MASKSCFLSLFVYLVLSAAASSVNVVAVRQVGHHRRMGKDLFARLIPCPAGEPCATLSGRDVEPRAEEKANPQPNADKKVVPVPKTENNVAQPKEDKAISQPNAGKDVKTNPQPNALPQANGLPKGGTLPDEEKVKPISGQPAGAANNGQPCPDGTMKDSAGQCPKPAANEGNGLPAGGSLPKDQKAKGASDQSAGGGNHGQPCTDGKMRDSAGNCPKPAASNEAGVANNEQKCPELEDSQGNCITSSLTNDDSGSTAECKGKGNKDPKTGACVLPLDDPSRPYGGCTGGKVKDPTGETNDCVPPAGTGMGGGGIIGGPGGADDGATCQKKDSKGKCMSTSGGTGKGGTGATGDGMPCGDGQKKDSKGKCVSVGNGAGGAGDGSECGYGKKEDKSGSCVPTTGDGPGGVGDGGACVDGQKKDKSGYCVPTTGGGACGEGQEKDKSGKCVPTSGNGAEGAGECPDGQTRNSKTKKCEFKSNGDAAGSTDYSGGKNLVKCNLSGGKKQPDKTDGSLACVLPDFDCDGLDQQYENLKAQGGDMRSKWSDSACCRSGSNGG